MKILIATDGKKHSETAIGFVGKLFQIAKPQISVLHVHPTDHEAEETFAQAKDYLIRAEEILKPFDIIVKNKMIKKGSIVKEILKECRIGGYDLLAIGSERLSSVITGLTESLLEDVHQEIARRLKISLLVVKNSSTDVKKVLICADGSSIAESAIEFWGQLPKEDEPRVTILNILPKAFERFDDELERYKPELLKALTTFGGPRAEIVERGRRILKEHNIDADIILREKKYASQEILQEENEGDYSLIIMGYRGKGHRGEETLGSQGLEVVRRSTGSVLIYKPPKIKNKR